MKNQLTKCAPGSVGELWIISWPLIIASAANMLMVLGDRVVLAKYSTEAFQSVSGVIPWWLTIYLSLLNITLIADVFVGRFNGAKDYKKIGSAIWQMLWFSLSMFPIMVILAWFVAPHMIAENLNELGLPYLRILLIFTPISMAAFGAFAAFFSGRGKTHFITVIVLISNVLNIVFDFILVFGIGPFPRLGTIGAAYGTVISQFVAIVLFALFFFTKKNQRDYDILNWKFDAKLFFESLKLGLPNAIGCCITMGLWSAIIQLAALYVSKDSFTVLVMGNTIFSVLFFFSEGIGQGVGIVSSNAYGAKNWMMVKKNMQSWFKLSLVTAAISFIFMVIYPNPLIALLLPSNASPSISVMVRPILLILWVMTIFDGYSFNFRMTLTAFGDTYFMMVTNLCCFIFLSVFPSYLALRFVQSVSMTCASWCFSAMAVSSICFLRLRRKLQCV